MAGGANTEADLATLAAARQHLDALGARPRPAGGHEEAAARDHARQTLERLGFSARDEPFAYSAFPGRWATSLGGVAGIGILALAGHLGARGTPWLALACLVAGLAGVAAAGLWFARRGVLSTPWLRRSGVNLVATRGRPTVWMMAHLDSKSQPVPILARAAGITLGSMIFMTAMGIAVAQGLGLVGSEWWAAVTIAGTLALLPVAASVVGERSDGAIDNASGCAAVLVAAEQLPRGLPLGILFTSAEELGLAGARAFARANPVGTCINCDGVDDAGRWTAMFTGKRPRALLEAAAAAGTATGLEVQPRRLLPGVLLDGVALADAGWQVITVSHGSVATLGRVHTPRDSRQGLSGTAIPAAGNLIATIVAEVG